MNDQTSRTHSAPKAAKERVRICMIGCGNMANSVHYPSLCSFNDVDLVGVCEMSADRLETTCNKFNIPTERRHLLQRPDDYQKVLASLQPDGVYVIGPPHIMIDAWFWCLENGFNLYIEKPMGLNWHQAQMLTDLAEKKKLVTQVSHQRRTVPLYHKVRNELITHGPITHGVVEFFKYAITPFYNARDHMMDDCTHSVDTARWICGGEVAKIESHCKRIGVPDINWIGATLHFDNGATCYIVNSWVSGRRVFRVQMHAPGAYTDAEVEGDAWLYVQGDHNGRKLNTREVACSDQPFVFGGFQAKNREFIDSLKYGKDVCSSPFRDTVKTMRVCEVILANALLNNE